jgi:hypothetical protein
LSSSCPVTVDGVMKATPPALQGAGLSSDTTWCWELL